MTLLEGSCLHDFYFYVLNDSECHSNCNDYISCDCETRPVAAPDDANEFSMDVGDMHVKLHH